MLDESRERLRAAISSIDNTLAQVKSRCQSSYECNDQNNIGNDCKKSKANEVEYCELDRANSNCAFVTTPHRLAPVLPEVALTNSNDHCHLSSSVIDTSCRWSNTHFVQQQEEHQEQNNVHQTLSAEKEQEGEDQLYEEYEECLTSNYTDKQFSANRWKEFDHILQLLRARREMDLFQFYNTRSKPLSEHPLKEFQNLSLDNLPSLTPLNRHHNIVLLPLYSNNNRSDNFTKELLCHTSPIRSHGVLQEILSNSQESKRWENLVNENVKGEEAASSSWDDKILTHLLESREMLRTAPVLQTKKQINDIKNSESTLSSAAESNNVKSLKEEHIVPASNTTINNSDIKEKSSVSLPDYFSSNMSSQLQGVYYHQNQVETEKEVTNAGSNQNIFDINSAMNNKNLLGQTTYFSATMSMKPNSQLVHMKQYVQEPENVISIITNNTNYNNNINDEICKEEEQQQQRKEIQEILTPLSMPGNIVRVINYEEGPSERSYKFDSNIINKNSVTDLQLPRITQNYSDIMMMYKKKSDTDHSVNVVNVPDIEAMQSVTASGVVNGNELYQNEELKCVKSSEQVHEQNTFASKEGRSEQNINYSAKPQDTLLEETRHYSISNNMKQSIQTPDDIVSVLCEQEQKAVADDCRESEHNINQDVVMEDDHIKYKEERSSLVNGSLLQKERYNEETDKDAHRITSVRSLSSNVYRASCPSPAPELLYETKMETHQKFENTVDTEEEARSTENDKWKEINEESRKELENVNVNYARPNNESVYNSSTLPSMLPGLPVEAAHTVENNKSNQTKENVINTIVENKSNNREDVANIATNNTIIDAPEVTNITTHLEEEEEEHQVDNEVMASVVSCDTTEKSEMIANHVDEDKQELLLLNNDADEFVAEEENKQVLSLSSPESSSSSSVINDKKGQLNKDNVIVKSTNRKRQHMINVKVAEAAQDHALSLLKSTGIRVTVHVYDKCIPALVQISQHNDDLLLYIQRVEMIKPNDQIASSLQSTPHVPTSASHLPFVQNTPITQRSSSNSLQKPKSLFPSALSLSSLPPPLPLVSSLHPMPSIAIPYSTLIESIRERDRLQQTTTTTQDNECNNDNGECHSTSNTDNSVFSSSEHLPAIQSTSSQQQQRSLITITHSPIMCNGSTLITPLTSIEEVMPSSIHKSHNKNTPRHNTQNKVVMNDDGYSNWCAPSCRTLFGKLQRHLRTPAHSRQHYSLWEDDKTPQSQSHSQRKENKLTPNLYISRQRPNEFSAAAHMSAYPLSLPQLHSQTASSHPREQSMETTHKQSTLPSFNINNNNTNNNSSNTRNNNNVSGRQIVKEVQHFPLMHARVCLPFASYNTSHDDMSSVRHVIDSREDDNNKGVNKHLHLPSLVETGQNALKLLRCHHCTIFADMHPVSSTRTSYVFYVLFPHHPPNVSHLTNPSETVLLILECATRLDWITLLMAMQAAQRSLLPINHTHLTSQSEPLSKTSSTTRTERDLQIHKDQVISYGRALWWLASQRLHYQHATRQQEMQHSTEKVQTNRINNNHNKIDTESMTSHKNEKTTTKTKRRRRAIHQHRHVSNANASTEVLTSNNNNNSLKKKKHSIISNNSNNKSGSVTKLKQLLQRKRH